MRFNVLLKSASCHTFNTLLMGLKPEFLFESCATANQWGLKSIHESYSAEGDKASPLVLAYSHFESTPSYDYLGIFISHKSKGRSGSYYYKTTLVKSGRKPYAEFLNAEGGKIEAYHVIEMLKELFEKPFVDYGYYKVYIYLRDELGFRVSKHSVYKLMKESGLLQSRYAISSKMGKRNWVKNLILQTQIPFDYWEFDIKYVWVSGKKRSMLTVLDVNSRWNLGQYCAFTIRKEDVISLFDNLFGSYELPTGVCVRSDNGSHRGGELLCSH